MYKYHPRITTPEADTVLWRYMDLWKFLDLVESNSIFLSRADLFEDKYEGLIANKKVQELDEKHKLKELNDFSENTLKKCTYISSWNGEKDETYPLWKIYTDYRNAISIKTSINNLIKSLETEIESTQFIGKVNYVDFNSPNYVFRANTFQFFLEKRDYFKFENETRIITELQYNGFEELLKLPTGIRIKVNLNTLIEEIKIAPLGDENFKKIIERKLNEKEIDASVSYSLV
jgi:hypothetical protein